MAKAPIEGQVKTRLCPPYRPADAAILASAFLLDTWSIANAAFERPAVLAFAGPLAGFPMELAKVDKFEQRGLDLGERIGAAINTVLSQRTDNNRVSAALVIGSDLPGLPVKHLHTARELLVDSDICIGPSADGGYYLIGAKRWHATALSEIAWSTNRTREQTIDDLRKRGFTVCLAPSYDDIDHAHDLDALMRTDRPAPFTRNAYHRLLR